MVVIAYPCRRITESLPMKRTSMWLSYWGHMHLKLPATRNLSQDNNRERLKLRIAGPLWGESAERDTTEESVNDVIMYSQYSRLRQCRPWAVGCLSHPLCQLPVTWRHYWTSRHCPCGGPGTQRDRNWMAYLSICLFAVCLQIKERHQVRVARSLVDRTRFLRRLSKVTVNERRHHWHQHWNVNETGADNHILEKSGPLFTKRTGLPQDLVKSRSREIRVHTFPNALKFDRHIGSSADVKFQSDRIIITFDLAVSRLREIWR